MSDQLGGDLAIGRDDCAKSAISTLPQDVLCSQEEISPETTRAEKSRCDPGDPDRDERGSAAVVGMASAALSGAVIGFLVGGNATVAVIVILTAIVSAYAGWQVRGW